MSIICYYYCKVWHKAETSWDLWVCGKAKWLWNLFYMSARRQREERPFVKREVSFFNRTWKKARDIWWEDLKNTGDRVFQMFCGSEGGVLEVSFVLSLEVVHGEGVDCDCQGYWCSTENNAFACRHIGYLESHVQIKPDNYASLNTSKVYLKGHSNYVSPSCLIQGSTGRKILGNVISFQIYCK